MWGARGKETERDRRVGGGTVDKGGGADGATNYRVAPRGDGEGVVAINGLPRKGRLTTRKGGTRGNETFGWEVGDPVGGRGSRANWRSRETRYRCQRYA